MKENTNKTNNVTINEEIISNIFNTLSNADNLIHIGIIGKRAKLFNSMALDFLSDEPIKLKAYILASEYQFQYDNVTDDIAKIRKRQNDIETQIKDFRKKAKAIVKGQWTLTKKVKGIEKTFTLEELENDAIVLLNDLEDKLLQLQEKQNSLYQFISNDNVKALLDIPVTDSEDIVFQLLRFELLNSKCLNIKQSFTELAKACQSFNRCKLTNKDTKESYLIMKNQFSELCDMFKTTKDTKGDFLKVKTFSFNQNEMSILSETLFSSASIGVIEDNGKAYYTLTEIGQPTILKNIVKVCIMKFQGVKITLEHIK